jgi:hypothetical protein
MPGDDQQPSSSVLALDAAPADSAPSWRARGAALVDALPYVDSLTPSERALADRLIEAEVRLDRGREKLRGESSSTAAKKKKKKNFFSTSLLNLNPLPNSSLPRPRPLKTTCESSRRPGTSTRPSSAP